MLLGGKLTLHDLGCCQQRNVGNILFDFFERTLAFHLDLNVGSCHDSSGLLLRVADDLLTSYGSLLVGDLEDLVGFILGVGAKMFTIAGPVIVYGVSASVVYGLIYWITTRF